MAIQINVKFKDPNTEGMALWPFILVAKDLPVRRYPKVMSHELIHCEAQKELLLIFFYLWYVIELVVRYFMYKDWNKAYKNICFEREAYCNERNFSYYKTRKHFSFLKYLNKHCV